MGNLINARLPRPARVPIANGEQEQRRYVAQGAAEKHCTPLAGWLWDVELHATREAGAIVGFGIAPAELGGRHAVSGEALDRRFDSGLPGFTHVREILGKLSLVYVDREGRSGGVFRHLPLAVGGEVAEMLVEFLRRHALSARTPKDRLNGGLFRWPLWRDYEPTISKGLLNHIGALYITGQLDVALRHAEIMAEVAVALSEPPFWAAGWLRCPNASESCLIGGDLKPRETYRTSPSQSRKPRLLNVN